MKTERLTLRQFKKSDFAAVHAYASRADNLIYMMWGPNDEAATRAFIEEDIDRAADRPRTKYDYAVTLNDGGRLIGGCNLHLKGGGEAELGWILHRDFWRRGYGAELGRALLAFGFGELRLRRVTATCDAENAASYKLMEKIGMRREGLFLDSRAVNRPAARPYNDEFSYAILRDEWEIRAEMDYYNALPYSFGSFIEVPPLNDGGIYLVCDKKTPAEPERKWVPEYKFSICAGGERVGGCNLRIGYTDGLYYGGQIGYNIDEPFRGRGYAGRGVLLLSRVARAHKMERLIITNDVNNHASRRVCEKLDLRLVREARVPEWCDLYREGVRFMNIFEWQV